MDVELACTLLQQVGASHGLSGVLQQGLDHRRRQAWVGLQQQRCGASDRRGRHRCARQVHLRFAVGLGHACGRDQRRVELGRQRVPCQQSIAGLGGSRSHDAVARGDQVGLEHVVGRTHPHRVGAAAACRPARTEHVDHVVGAGRRALEVDRADRDDARVVARRRDGTVDRHSGGVHAEVACGGNHRDALRHRAARCRAQRIVLPAVGGVHRQAQVHDSDVVFLGVVDHPLDALERVAQSAGAEVVEHLDVIHIGVGRNAGKVRRDAVGCGAAGRDRSDVRAVAISVLHGVGAVVDSGLVARQCGAARLQRGVIAVAVGPVGQRGGQELHVLDHTCGARGVVEGFVALHHARVHDGDAYARAVQSTVGGLGRSSAHASGRRAGDGLQRAGGATGLAIRGDEPDVVARCDLVELPCGQRGRQHAQAGEAGVDGAARLDDVRAQTAHGRVGVAADEHRLHHALAVLVARPARLRRRRGVDAGLQVLRQLVNVAVATGRVGSGEAEAREQQRDGGDCGHDGLGQAAALDQDDEA